MKVRSALHALTGDDRERLPASGNSLEDNQCRANKTRTLQLDDENTGTHSQHPSFRNKNMEQKKK